MSIQAEPALYRLKSPLSFQDAVPHVCPQAAVWESHALPLYPASAQVFPTRFGSQCGLNMYRMGNYRETKSWREVVSGKSAATHRFLK